MSLERRFLPSKIGYYNQPFLITLHKLTVVVTKYIIPYPCMSKIYNRERYAITKQILVFANLCICRVYIQSNSFIYNICIYTEDKLKINKPKSLYDKFSSTLDFTSLSYRGPKTNQIGNQLIYTVSTLRRSTTA